MFLLSEGHRMTSDMPAVQKVRVSKPHDQQYSGGEKVTPGTESLSSQCCPLLGPWAFHLLSLACRPCSAHVCITVFSFADRCRFLWMMSFLFVLGAPDFSSCCYFSPPISFCCSLKIPSSSLSGPHVCQRDSVLLMALWGISCSGSAGTREVGWGLPAHAPPRWGST